MLSFVVYVTKHSEALLQMVTFRPIERIYQTIFLKKRVYNLKPSQ